MVGARENATMTVLDRLVRDWRAVTGVGRRTALVGLAAVLVGVALAVTSLGVFAASEAVSGGDRYWTLRRLAGVAAAYPTNWNGGPATATFEVAALYVAGTVLAVAALSGAVLSHRRAAGEDADGGEVDRGDAFRETERGEGGFDWVSAPEQE